MKPSTRISWPRARVPVIFQSAAAECGLACLAMIATYHGLRIDLAAIRDRFSVSMRGTTLAHLLRFAGALGLAGRPLRIELEDIPYLQMPCILHWDMDHFVVLRKVSKKHIFVHDPAIGSRKITYTETSRHFTGVALELTPAADFTPAEASRPFGIRDLSRGVTGWKRSIVQIFCLAAVLELLLLISPLFLQVTVDHVISSYQPRLLLLLGSGFAALVVLQSVFSGLRGWMTLSFGTSLKLQWYTNIFSHLMKLPVSYFEKRYFGDILSRFDGAEAVQRTLTNNFAEALLDGAISLLVLAVIGFYSVKIALIVVVGLLAYISLRNLAYRRLRGLTEEQIIRMARQQGFLIETLRGIRTIKVFSREAHRNTRWMNLAVDSANAQVATEKLGIVLKSANTLIFGLQSVAVIWFGANRVLSGAITVGMLFALIAYQEQFTARVSTLVDRLFEVRMLSLQLQRLGDITLEKPEPSEPGSNPEPAGDTAIEVRSLSFRYSEMEPWLLQDISFRIAPGECVAITGASGAGKSTLLKLLSGLLPPQKGEVAIGGHSLSRGRAAVAGLVGFVLQDDSLFGGTVADNIAFAADTPDMERVESCARMACLHEEIKSMPMGYKTLIGDMGSALSGGQQQRLLLARALYAQPSILILDEATSHLDIATEQAIAAMLASLKITRIFAAHRPETIAIADRTIHLESPATVRTRQAAVSANGNGADPYLHNKFGSPNGPKTEKGELHVKHESEASA